MRPRVLPLVLLALTLLCSCTSYRSRVAPDAGVSDAAGPGAATSSVAHLTVVGESDPVASAQHVSRTLFRAADVVVLARAGDLPGTLLGASAAVALGVPLLLQPPGGGDGGLGRELDRLGAGWLLAVGGAGLPAAATGSSATGSAAAGSGGDARPTVVTVAATATALAAAGVPLGAARRVGPDDAATAIAALRAGATDALVPDRAPAATTSAGAATPAAGGDGAARVPPVRRPRPVQHTVVLATGGPESLAGLATARAAGAQVEMTGGGADPRASSALVTALAQARPRSVVALGAAFAADKGLEWQLATAATGRQLPGGGQVLFPGRTLVALYGTPGTAALGVLGEQDLPASIERARQHAARYRSLVAGPVVPTFEIIATVASGAAGPDGNYSTEIDPAKLRPWVLAAQRAGLYVVLDLQPGRSDFLTQAKRYQSLLRLADVGLALDPEWRLGPGELPLQQIGSVGIDEVNRVVDWLADLTRAALLPQKLLVLHQFRPSMIAGRDRLDTARPELAVVLHADGQGTQGNKQATWRTLHRDLPGGPLFWGWKNFYDEDHPMLTPDQTVAQVRPTPNLISYQ